MATLTKARARKPVAAGNVNTGYANYVMPLMPTREHITISLGEYTLRLTMAEASMLLLNVSKYMSMSDKGPH